MITIEKMQARYIALGALCFFVLGFYVGKYQEMHVVNDFITHFKPLRTVSEYPLINPLVGIESESATRIGIYTDLARTVTQTIDQSHKEGVTKVAFYFRDFNSSLWFGVNEDDMFLPASLLKLPYAIAAYKAMEEDKQLYTKKFVYTQAMKDINLKRGLSETSVLVVGSSYTLPEIVETMIVKSDNGARDMLAQIIPEKNINRIYLLAGLREPNEKENFQLSAKSYGLFLRMLYGASYLNDKNSSTLLGFLSRSNFNGGLKKFIPQDVPVVHKWGVMNFSLDKNAPHDQELHDCGIIYLPEKPYLLCIMTQGKTQDALANTIGTLSKQVYEYVLSSKNR